MNEKLIVATLWELVSKLQSQIWEKSNNNSEENFSLSEIDDDVLQNLIGKDIDKLDDGKYHLK